MPLELTEWKARLENLANRPLVDPTAEDIAGYLPHLGGEEARALAEELIRNRRPAKEQTVYVPPAYGRTVLNALEYRWDQAPAKDNGEFRYELILTFPRIASENGTKHRTCTILNRWEDLPESAAVALAYARQHWDGNLQGTVETGSLRAIRFLNPRYAATQRERTPTWLAILWSADNRQNPLSLGHGYTALRELTLLVSPDHRASKCWVCIQCGHKSDGSLWDSHKHVCSQRSQVSRDTLGREKYAGLPEYAHEYITDHPDLATLINYRV